MWKASLMLVGVEDKWCRLETHNKCEHCTLSSQEIQSFVGFKRKDLYMHERTRKGADVVRRMNAPSM